MWRGLSVAALVVTGCAPQVAEAPTRVEPQRTPRAPAATVVAPPVDLPVAAEEAPAWLAPQGDADGTLLDHARTEHVGFHTALALSGPDESAPTFAWAVDTKSEKVHRIRPPRDSVRLLLVGKKDAVLAVTSGGELFRAESPAAAREAAAFVRIGSQPGIERWDAAGRWLAGAVGAEVVLSANEGKTFRRRTVLSSGHVESLVVRDDGLVLANVTDETAPGLYLSFGGGPFRRSPTTVDGVHRAGRWILGGSATCSDGGVVVLARGTTKWMAGVDRALDIPDPARVLALSAEPAGFTKVEHFTMAGPEPPALDPTKVLPPDAPATMAWGCDTPRLSVRQHVTRGSAVGEGAETGQLSLVDHARLASARQHAFLSNAHCAGESDQPGGRCAFDAELSEPAQVVRFGPAKDDADIFELPTACSQPSLDDYGGLGMLTCFDEPAARYFFIGDDPRFVQETPPQRPGAFASQGSDGSLLFRAACQAETACPWLVRRPVPPGAEQAWWTFSTEPAMAARLLADGRVLLVHREGVVAPETLGPLQTIVSVSVIARGEPERAVATSIRLRAPTHDVVARDGHVVFVGRDASWTLLRDGSLAAPSAPSR